MAKVVLMMACVTVIFVFALIVVPLQLMTLLLYRACEWRREKLRLAQGPEPVGYLLVRITYRVVMIGTPIAALCLLP